MSDLINASANTSDFFKQLAVRQSSTERPKPIYVTLDGREGVWIEKRFSETEKKSEKIPWKTGGPWSAAILLIKWFAKDKYKEGATVSRRTREFMDWSDKIEYLEIDYTKKGPEATKVIGSFDGYTAFKDAQNIEYGRMVNAAMRDKKPIPSQMEYKSDLWASIYVYDFEKDRIVNVKLKGVSRKSVFDYLKDWRRGVEGADSYSQVLTQFDSVKFTEPQTFYAAKLRAECVLSEPHQEKVKEAFLSLVGWMKSFDEVVEEEPKEEVKTEEPKQEIDLGSIPF